jgi:hypothetical protein
MTVVLTVRTLINKFRFFKISRMAGNSTNEKFIPKRPLIHFLIIEPHSMGSHFYAVNGTSTSY